MSLAKLARTTFIPGAPDVPYQPYSKSCPPPAPAPAPAPVPGSSGGVSGCVQVPIYGIVATATQGDTGYDQTMVYSTGVIGYYEVCGG